MKNGKFYQTTCFTKGTLVTLVKREYRDKGLETTKRDKNLEILIPIEEVTLGDYVLSRDEKSGEFVYRKVYQLFVNKTELLFNLELSNNTKLVTTWNHPFWLVAKKAWVQVKDNHTYAVGLDSIVVHNDNKSYWQGFTGQIVRNLANESPSDASGTGMYIATSGAILGEPIPKVDNLISKHVNDILALDPKAKIGYRRSLARGQKGSHKENVPFDSEN